MCCFGIWALPLSRVLCTSPVPHMVSDLHLVADGHAASHFDRAETSCAKSPQWRSNTRSFPLQKSWKPKTAKDGLQSSTPPSLRHQRRFGSAPASSSSTQHTKPCQPSRCAASIKGGPDTSPEFTSRPSEMKPRAESKAPSTRSERAGCSKLSQAG